MPRLLQPSIAGALKPIHRVLVTGGAGFIGSHTVELLLSQGKQVVVLDNLSSGSMFHLPRHDPHLEFVEGDVLEFPLVEDLLAGCDAVLHLAAIASVPLSIEDPVYTFQVNTQGFLHVLEAIHRAVRPIRLVHASSAAVYGQTSELPCRDDVSLYPPLPSPYAQQKFDNERYGELYAQLYQVPSLALRYFNVYGPRQHPDSSYAGVISRFIDAYRQEQTLTIYGDGKQQRDFIHVSDVARANVLALTSDYTGVLNIATGKPHTLLNLIKYLEDGGSRSANVHFEPARPGDIKASYASTHLAEEVLQFQPSITLQDGVKEMLSIA